MSDHKKPYYWVNNRLVDGSTKLSIELSIENWLFIQASIVALEEHIFQTDKLIYRRVLSTRKKLVRAIIKARGNRKHASD